MKPLWKNNDILKMAKCLPSLETSKNHDLIVYLAGLWDGEGCFGIYAFNRSPPSKFKMYHERAIVRMCDSASVDILCNLFNTKRLIAKPKQGYRRQTYSFCASTAKASLVAATLYPYLINKKKQAEVLLAFRICKQVRWIRTEGLKNRPFKDWHRREMQEFVDYIKALKGENE